MTEQAFFQTESKSRIAATIREIEAQTSAEVVVAVKHVSGNYQDADYLAGFLFALLALALLLFLPVSFPVATMPVDVVVAFVLGALLTGHAPPLRRLLVTRRRMDASVYDVARAAFVDRGISHTTRRGGILVFVSTFERTAQVVTDVGVDTKGLGEPWKLRVAAVRDAVAQLDTDRFVEELRAMGPLLGAAMPHKASDANELPDEVEES
jgi:putative membrane protein